MKKSNVILQAAIASALLAMVGGAQAGVLSGTAAFATEIAGPTATAALAIKPVPVVYTFNTPGGIVINPGGSIYVYYRLSGSAGTPLFTAAPNAAGGGGDDFAMSVGIAGIDTAGAALSTDSTTVRVTLTNGATDNQTIGVGGTLTWTPAAGAVSGVNTALATAGGTISAQASIGSTASLPNTGTALPADLDSGLSNTLAIATSAEAITSAVAASSSFAVVETQKIDLTATSPGSRFTSPGVTLSNANSVTLLNLGSVTFTNTGGNQVAVDGTTDYTIAGRGTANTLAGTVTGSFKTGATAFLATDLTCTTGITAGSNATLNAGLTIFTWAAAGTLPTSATPNYICLNAPATTGAIPIATPTAAFTFTKTTTTDAADSASGTLYALGNNGVTKVVRNYVPSTLAGYPLTVRITNTGTVPAPVTITMMGEDGATIGTPYTTTSFAINETRRVLQAEIETGVGNVPVSTARPRLIITAPTNAMDVQTFINTPGQGYTNLSGTE